MPPHGHGAVEEEVIKVRTDGPPFVDVHAKQGRGFDVDYDKVQKYLGPGKISLAEFMRDMDLLNKAYIPTAHRSYQYMRAGSGGMMGGLVIMIIMGIVAESPAVRGVVMPVALVMALLGMVVFVYSKFLEQPGIRAGAELVKRMVESDINPKYTDSQYRIRWTVQVKTKTKHTYHMGKQFLERPVITIWALRSANEEGVLTDWVLPDGSESMFEVHDDAPQPGANGRANPDAVMEVPQYNGPGLMSSQPAPVLSVDTHW
jgi:hypothetical protein